MTTPLDTLRALRATYPTPMSSDQLGALLNAVAWTHRADGLGMFAKPTGANCRQPRTGILISRDYLVYRDGRGYDVLLDAEGKGTPTWGKVHTMDKGRWVPAIDASVTLPLPPPIVKPTWTYPGDHFGTAVGEVLFADYARANHPLNASMGVWFLRTLWDVANPPHLSPEASLAKHRAEWRVLLGLD